MDERFARKYRDPRWQKRRLQVLEAADFACQMCGAKDKELHVHHSFYRKDTAPWDYAGLTALCNECHKHAEAGRKMLIDCMASLPLQAIYELLGHAVVLHALKQGWRSIPIISKQHGHGEEFDVGIAAALGMTLKELRAKASDTAPPRIEFDALVLGKLHRMCNVATDGDHASA